MHFSTEDAYLKDKKMAKNRINPLAVVFDMDGLIFDSERLVLHCWVEIGKRHGLEGLEAVFKECIGTNKARTKEIVYANLGSDFPYDEFSKESSALFKEIMHKDGLPIKDGVVKTLKELKQRGIPLGLASSTRLAVVEEELRDAGLLDYFQVVMGGDLLKRSKPEPDIYLMTCEKLGVDPTQCYALEDSYNGIISAYRAGMKPIMIPDMLPPTEEMREKSQAILTSMEDFIDWMDGVL